MPYASCMFLSSSVKNVTKLQVENASSLFSSDTPWLLDCRTWVRCVVLLLRFFFFFFFHRSMYRSVSQSCVGEGWFGSGCSTLEEQSFMNK